MLKSPNANAAADEAPVSANLLASLLIERALTTPPTSAEPERLSLRVYLVMATTALLTFATLVAGYQLLLSHPSFA